MDKTEMHTILPPAKHDPIDLLRANRQYLTTTIQRLEGTVRLLKSDIRCYKKEIESLKKASAPIELTEAEAELLSKKMGWPWPPEQGKDPDGQYSLQL